MVVLLSDKPYNIQVSPTSVDLNEKESFNLICNASSNPPGEYSWSFNGNVLDGETDKVLAKRDISRDDAGEYRCTVTNNVGSGASNISVVKVRYLEECKTNKYTLTNKQNLTLSPKGFPEPTLTCAKGYFNLIGSNTYTLSIPEAGNDNCTISNAAGKCQFEYEVLLHVAPFTFSAVFRLTNRAYRQEFNDKNSSSFKKLKEEIENELKSVYESYKIVNRVRVIAFREGSVNVDFNLDLVANVSDPLSPLKNALTNAGGNLSGLVIDPSSLQAGSYILPTTTILTTVETTLETGSSAGCQVSVIVLGVLFGVSLIFNVIFVGCFIWRHLTENNRQPKESENMNEVGYMGPSQSFRSFDLFSNPYMKAFSQFL
ncbi:B-cell receptor CD22 [Exaiptasia diaphana]|nr:B-cell receptor CD22 [Exaiptasia diaphana]